MSSATPECDQAPTTMVLPQQPTPPPSTEVYGPQMPPSTTCSPDAKTPVSVLVELSTKMGIQAEFETISETGPSHDKTFVIKCTVGGICGQGVSNSKKKAKQEAAHVTLMKLDESKLYQDYLHGWTNRTSQKPQSNAVNHLQEVVVKRGWETPVYEIVDSAGLRHTKEFETRVSIGNKVASGKGRSKKESKRTAAEAMLNLVSTANLSLQPPNKKIAFVSSGSVTQKGPIAFQSGGVL